MSDVMTMRYLGVNHVNDMTNVDKSQEFLGDESHVTTTLTSRNNEKGP